jgi:hypothetical protein
MIPARKPVWGVGASGYAGDPFGGPFLFAYCDATIYLSSPSRNCFQQIPFEFGKKSLSVSYTKSISGCEDGSPAYGTCSGALGTELRLGRLDIDAVTSASGNPSDPNATTEGSSQVSAFTDAITVTSSTLPPGTPVTIKESLSMSKSFAFSSGSGSGSASGCGNVGLKVASYRMNGEAGYLLGECEGTEFVQTTSSGVGTKEAANISTTVGSVFTVTPNLNVQIAVSNCTLQSNSRCTAWGGSYSAVMQNVDIAYHLTVVTKGASYQTASGKSY